MTDIKLSINELFDSAVDKDTSPMQWIEDDSCEELVVFMRAVDYQDFCFIADIADDKRTLTMTEYTLDDEPVELSTEQLALALSIMQTMFDDTMGDGCDYPYNNCTDHGLRNSDFIYGYSA